MNQIGRNVTYCKSPLFGNEKYFLRGFLGNQRNQTSSNSGMGSRPRRPARWEPDIYCVRVALSADRRILSLALSPRDLNAKNAAEERAIKAEMDGRPQEF